MGILTPEPKEYDFLSMNIVEGIKLWGQECQLYAVESRAQDGDMDTIKYYKKPLNGYILFADDIQDAKLKNKSHWSKETGEYIEAFVGLNADDVLTVDTIIDIIPRYHNSNSKFIVQRILGQINTYYYKIQLVPYRESQATSTDPEKVVDGTVTDKDGIITDKPFLKR